MTILRSTLQRLTREMLDDSTLQYIVEACHQEVLAEFLACRLHIAKEFVGVLEAGICAAEDIGDSQLRDVMIANLKEEHGIGHADGSHQEWRDEMCRDLSLPPLESSSARERYSASMHELNMGSSWRIVGGILYFEFHLPSEFRMLKKAIRRVYGDIQVRYIDDHIQHDAAEHFPQLWEAVNSHMEDAPRIAGVLLEGATHIAQAKRDFYGSFAVQKNSQRE